MGYKNYYQRKLPHFHPHEGVLFITFRVDFPIPERFLFDLNYYKKELELSYLEMSDKTANQAIIRKKLFAFTDDFYHTHKCSIGLTDNQDIANIVFSKIIALNGVMYYLYTFTLMPNHVHILIKPINQSSIGDIMKSIKGETSRRINQLLNRAGTFWYREYYDHWVRDNKELVNILDYIRQNPVKAGLVQNPDAWQWTWINPDFLKS